MEQNQHSLFNTVLVCVGKQLREAICWYFVTQSYCKMNQHLKAHTIFNNGVINFSACYKFQFGINKACVPTFSWHFQICTLFELFCNTGFGLSAVFKAVPEALLNGMGTLCYNLLQASLWMINIQSVTSKISSLKMEFKTWFYELLENFSIKK